MAILKFGAIVTEGSGSLGGHTIQHSKGGMQIRTKPIPRGNPSASQTLIRSINQQLQAGWRALTPSQQKIWNDWPATHGIMNAKGDKHPLSGHSLWMKYNFSWIQAGGTFLPDPSYWGGPILGPELILNGTFVNSSYWSHVGGWTISGGKANFLAILNYYLNQEISIPALPACQFEFDVSNCPGTAWFGFHNQLGNHLFAPPYNAYFKFVNGHYKWITSKPLSHTFFKVTPISLDFIYSIDNISLKQIF